MGQAKQRGTKEERIAQARAQLSEETPSLGTLDSWLARARSIAKGLDGGELLFNAFEVVLRFVWEQRHAGACHDTSAVLYMLMSEQGLVPTLNLGEVKAAAGIFDHSWVEVDGLIFDAAVCLPQEAGAHVGGPIFASVDLAANRPTELKFAVTSGRGLDAEALLVASLSLSDYAKIQPQMNIWVLAVAFGARIGLEITFDGLMLKYGTVKRIYRDAAVTA